MNCPQCNGSCYRDEVDIGVGTQYGPWRCEECAWYEGWQYDAKLEAEMGAERLKRTPGDET